MRRNNPGSTGESERLRVVMALRVGPNILRIVLQQDRRNQRFSSDATSLYRPDTLPVIYNPEGDEDSE